jgi:hypothetical protein
VPLHDELARLTGTAGVESPDGTQYFFDIGS